MLTLLLLTAGIVLVAMLFLCIGVLVRGQFRSQHIGHSREMRKRGITCVQSMDAVERKKDPHHATRMERGGLRIKD